MPIYEFYSPDTNKIYSFFARRLSMGGLTPRCPDDPKARMERVLSKFAVTGRARENTAPPGPTDPRMERVLGELQREMAGIDEKNPDPRAIGQLMRRMSDATGQAMPTEMNQMIERLEAGEDPEKLESEFGDALDNLNFPDTATDPSGGTSRVRQRVPKRDPVLYEMSDFL
jgi:hypothetical protein